MGDFSHPSQVWNIHFGISDGLQEDKTGLVVHGLLYGLRVCGLHKAGCNAILLEYVRKEEICGHKQGIPCHKLISLAK